MENQGSRAWCSFDVAIIILFALLLGIYAQDESTKPRIYSLHIMSDIKFRFATTLVTSRVVNPGKNSKEAVFDIILPNEAYIANFTLEIGGKIYTGQIKEKEQAKKEYDKAKKRGQSAGHVSQKPRETNSFKVEVNVAAQDKVTFNLTYQELLKRNKGTYTHTVYINPGQPVADMRVDVAILESREITKLRVPPIRNDLLTDIDITETNDIAIIQRPTEKSVYITYIPSMQQQMAKSANGISGQFVVEYDVAHGLGAGDLLVVKGYFVHFFAPQDINPLPKDVLFVLDTSGSMIGTKLVQLQQAMLRMLNELHEGDQFNILRFDSNNQLWRKTMQRIMSKHHDSKNSSSRRAAEDYITQLTAGGSTNINSALLKAIEVLKTSQIEGERSPLILFLTDGEATAGVRNKDEILANVRRANEGEISIFSLAFGQFADYDLVKRVAVENNGIGRKIYEDSDAALQISGFYDEIAITLMKNVSFQYLSDEVNSSSVTKSIFSNYFRGSEMVVAGKLEDSSADTVTLEILGNSIDGAFTLKTISHIKTPHFRQVEGLTSLSDIEEISEKIWAYLTIKQILEKSLIEKDPLQKEQMKFRALQLSLKYNFVTPLTSMVVTKPDVGYVGDTEDSQPRKDTSTTPRRVVKKKAGRGYAGGGGGDPHFMVRIIGISHPFCFDVRTKPGETYRLLQDPIKGMTINAEIKSGHKLNKYGEPRTYIGKLFINIKQHNVTLTTDFIQVDGNRFPWSKELTYHLGGNTLVIKDNGYQLLIRCYFGAEVLIKRHVVNQTSGTDSNSGTDFLNVYIERMDGFSKAITGLIDSSPPYMCPHPCVHTSKILMLLFRQLYTHDSHHENEGIWSTFFRIPGPSNVERIAH
ncbi:hypothetical protein ACJMK2_017184 [Sinanodonta woodiana]|uniref:Inter-alpha-trypsin inhibitor heavy chain H3 n=1 Tax=Sinanodonta woodiana TaxID=1069815 RepID=A0ABD3UW34_SINWO